MKTLLFLSDFWQKANTAISEIEVELPIVEKEDILRPIGVNMWIINYSDLQNSWSPSDILKRGRGKSIGLELLVDKLKSVFKKSPDKVVEFLISTSKRGFFINKLSGDKIVLSPNELARLKMYIKENM